MKLLPLSLALLFASSSALADDSIMFKEMCPARRVCHLTQSLKANMPICR
jgi:hypothetical protein